MSELAPEIPVLWQIRGLINQSEAPEAMGPMRMAGPLEPRIADCSEEQHHKRLFLRLKEQIFGKLE